MWFAFAFLGYFLLAVVFILDKLILTKSVSKPVVYTFYSTIFLFGALLAWPFGVELLGGVDWIIAILSGVSFGLALWALFVGLKKGETSHISPFNGAFVTIFTYLVANYFLGEKLSDIQIVGLVILVFSSLLLSFEKSRKFSGFHVGFLWAGLSGLLFAISHVSAKYLYEIYPFFTAFVWTRAFIGLVGLFTLLFPSVRDSFKKTKNKKEKKKKKNTVIIVVTDKVLAVLAVILIQYAAAVGPVAPVFALSGVQFVFIFIMVYLLTKFAPKLFKEYFTKKEIAVEVIAILLVMLGSALFVI
ncbi:MAG: DMT family transporter [bacterium]|nr:DMT family transporter [bacterium]